MFTKKIFTFAERTEKNEFITDAHQPYNYFNEIEIVTAAEVDFPPEEQRAKAGVTNNHWCVGVRLA